MTTAAFRKEVARCFPHVKVSVRTIAFTDLARRSAPCLTITGARSAFEVQAINELAQRAGIVPDKTVRNFAEGSLPAWRKGVGENPAGDRQRWYLGDAAYMRLMTWVNGSTQKPPTWPGIILELTFNPKQEKAADALAKDLRELISRHLKNGGLRQTGA